MKGLKKLNMDKLLDLKKLRSFLTVADTYSFAKAAELLHYSPASLTLQIQSLEHELGVTLFDRIKKHIYLTNEGVRLYEYAQEFMRLNDDTLDAFGEDAAFCGHLRIGTIASLASYLFPHLLRQFHDKYPQISVSVVTDTPSVLYQKLAYNELDVLIVLDEALASPELKTILRFPIRVVPCVSKEHPLAAASVLSLESLISYPCILTEPDASYRRLFDQTLAKSGHFVSPVIESDSVDLIFSLLRNSQFFSVFPSIILEESASAEEVVPLQVENWNLNIQLQIFCNHHKHISRTINAFLSVTRNYLHTAFAERSLSVESTSDSEPLPQEH